MGTENFKRRGLRKGLRLQHDDQIRSQSWGTMMGKVAFKASQDVTGLRI